MAIPTGITRYCILFLSYKYSWISYPGIIICSFLYLYPTFVVLHIMAQGYANIKNTALSTETKQNIKSVDVCVSKGTQKKKITKIISKNRTTPKQQLVKTKQTTKIATKKTKKSSKVK